MTHAATTTATWPARGMLRAGRGPGRAGLIEQVVMPPGIEVEAGEDPEAEAAAARAVLWFVRYALATLARQQAGDAAKVAELTGSAADLLRSPVVRPPWRSRPEAEDVGHPIAWYNGEPRTEPWYDGRPVSGGSGPGSGPDWWRRPP